MVKYLVKHDGDVNCKTVKNHSILHYAVWQGSLEIVKYLALNGAKITMEECQGDQTVLFEAVKNGDEAIVDFLLRHGAMRDIHDCDRSGRSLLYTACHAGNSALVQTLLKYKVDLRKEKELLCGNEEVANIINLELKKSIKHREKIESLRFLGDEKLKKVSHFYFVCMLSFLLAFR